MSVTAKLVPWSSVVGQAITLHDATGRVIAQLALHAVQMPRDCAGFTNEEFKARSVEIGFAVANAINRGQAP